MICIQDKVLDLGLRAQELHLYMQMIKVSEYQMKQEQLY